MQSTVQQTLVAAQRFCYRHLLLKTYYKHMLCLILDVHVAQFSIALFAANVVFVSVCQMTSVATV